MAGLIDFINAGNLEDLSDRWKSNTALQWEDIAPLFRNFSAIYKGRTYAIPLDGDFHIIYYRTDLLKEAGLTPPGTWEEYLAIAKRFHGNTKEEAMQQIEQRWEQITNKVGRESQRTAYRASLRLTP